MRQLIPPLIALPLLIGCASPVSDCNLLPLKAYPESYSMKLADEIESAPADVIWPSAVTDYVALRSAVRACRND